MSIEREFRRRAFQASMKASGRRSRCRKCGSRMTEKGFCDWVCPECGWEPSAQVKDREEEDTEKGLFSHDDNTDVYCPYCHKSDPSPLNAETVKYSGLEVSIVGHGTVLRVRNFSDDECVNFDHQDAIIINYCPMCGRHLHSTV